MKTYNRIYEETPTGVKEIVGYRCVENPRITIMIERGSISHNRPTGFTIMFDGKTDWTNNLVSYLTLNEAKEMLNYYFKD